MAATVALVAAPVDSKLTEDPPTSFPSLRRGDNGGMRFHFDGAVGRGGVLLAFVCFSDAGGGGDARIGRNERGETFIDVFDSCQILPVAVGHPSGGDIVL
jgi:hypothetical protein